MAKGAYLKDLKPIIEGMVTNAYLANRGILAKNAVNLVNEQLKEKHNREVSLSLITGMLTKLHAKDQAGDLDGSLEEHWSIGCCMKYDIPAEIIPTLIEIRKNFKEPFVLTIRQAKWMIRLLPSVKELVKNQFWNIVSAQAKLKVQYCKMDQSSDLKIREKSELYENEYKREIELIQQLLKFAPEEIKHMYELDLLYQVGILYAKVEQVNESMEKDFIDTSELDDTFFVRDISAEAIQDAMWRAFAPPQLKEQAVNVANYFKDLSLEQLESRLGKLTPNQLAVFKEYFPMIILGDSIHAKEWDKNHPGAYAELVKLAEVKENERTRRI